MRFQLPAETFAAAIGAAAPAASTRGGVEILKGSHWRAEEGRLHVTCTDMESTATGTVACEVTEPGSAVCAVPTAAQLRAFKALKGEMVSVEVAESAILQAGSTRCTLKLAKVEDFPVFAAIEDPAELDPAGFAEVLASVLPSVGSDAGRPVLCAAGLEVADGSLVVAGTDSYRLRVRSMPAPGLPATSPQGSPPVPGMGAPGPHVVPGAGLEIVRKALGRKGVESLRYGLVGGVAPRLRSGFVVETPGLTSTVQVLHTDGTFPNWRQLIPDSFTSELDLPREALLGTLAKIRALVRTQGNAAIRVKVPAVKAGRQGTMGLSLSDWDGVEAEDACPVAGAGMAGAEACEVGFNPAWLAGGLDSFQDDTVRLHGLNPLRPWLLTSEAHRAAAVDGSTGPGSVVDVYLLMPIRLHG